MKRNDAALLAATHDDMAAALTNLLEAEAFQSPDDVSSRKDGINQALSATVMVVTSGAPESRSGNSSR
jgi:hypothetical protein